MERNTIFRDKSIERISSPEQLNEYLKVCNPCIWLILIAVIILLAGACTWGAFGRLDSKLDIVAIAEEGQISVFIKETDVNSVVGKTVTVNSQNYTITSDMIEEEPCEVSTSEFSDYALHTGELEIGEWVYSIKINAQVPDGTYKAQIVTDSVSPMSFVFN